MWIAWERIRETQDSVTGNGELLLWKRMRDKNRDFGLYTRRETNIKQSLHTE
jgi:hypothetical protein